MTGERGRTEAADTRSRILDVAERLVQTRGFNGFSYADIAAELQISKASLHYHFPSKAELGEALIGRYAARFGDFARGLFRFFALSGQDTHACAGVREQFGGCFADAGAGTRDEGNLADERVLQ